MAEQCTFEFVIILVMWNIFWLPVLSRMYETTRPWPPKLDWTSCCTWDFKYTLTHWLQTLWIQNLHLLQQGFWNYSRCCKVPCVFITILTFEYAYWCGVSWIEPNGRYMLFLCCVGVVKDLLTGQTYFE
jgi:hypothetical protein